MEERRLTKKDILTAIGSQDYLSLNKWLAGKLPVHIAALLKICNHFSVPLANFFCDSDGDAPGIVPSRPSENAQCTPTANYGIRTGAGRRLVPPAPGECPRPGRASQGEASGAPEPQRGAGASQRLEHIEDMRALESAYRAREDALRQEHKGERERLLGIIEQQARLLGAK